jgi:acyl carrier protein
MAKQPKEASNFWKAVKAGVRLTHGEGRIKPVPVGEKPPLSFGQERLWQIDCMNPGSVGHNLRSAIRLRGPLDEDILKRSMEEIIKRHESLRTTFGAGGNDTLWDNAFQIVSEDVRLDFIVVDMNDIPVLQQDEEIKRIAAEEVQRPFNLAVGPLIRVKLVHLWELDWLLLRTIHHIISDRWSDSVFMRELSSIYTAFKEGRPSPLKALPIQYKDYAWFQRKRMTGELATSHIDYWKAHFAGDFPVLRLPEDKESAKVLSYRGSSEYLVLDGEFLDRLHELSVNCRVSLYVVLLSAFKTLLFTYSRQKTMIICSPVAGRSRLETKKLIGYFNNVIFVKTEMEDSLTFRQIIKRVDRQICQAIERQELPVQHIMDALGIPGAVISRCMFALQNVPNQPNKMADVSLTPLDLEEGISNFDLSLSFKKAGKGLTGVMRYKTDLFTRGCITGMLEFLKKLLETLAKFPNNALKDLPFFEDTPACKPLDIHREHTAIPPESEMEQTVADVWKEGLGLSVVDIKTSFFDLGGKSLGMVKVCGRLQQIFNREIPLMELFKNPTVEGIADYLSRNRVKEEINTRPVHGRKKMWKEAMKRRQKKVMKVRGG